MSRPALPAIDIARTVVFAALIAVLGLFPGIYLGAAAVPIVLQNAGPLLAGSLLGARRGAAATLLFLFLAAVGLPVLSGGRGGLGALLGPSGGFALGYALAAFVVGLIVWRAMPGSGGKASPGILVLLLANAAGMVAMYVVGIPWWGVYTGDLGSAAVQSVIFLPGDLVKLVLVSLIAVAVHRALPRGILGQARTTHAVVPPLSQAESGKTGNSEPDSSDSERDPDKPGQGIGHDQNSQGRETE